MDFPDNIVLIWNSLKDWNVIYTNDKPSDKIQYITSINLRKLDKKLNVYGYINHNSIDNIIPRNMKKIKNKSLLISNLQKSIRRGDIDKALVTTANLILIDILTFLRRIIIISIEDVCVTNNITLLVWLMIAYPNYEITNEIIQYLLLTVYSLCTYSKKYIPDTNNDFLDYDRIDFNNKITNSLLIREEFGGMKGDMELIRKIVNSKNMEILKVKTGNLKVTRDITKNDILKESIDFHCYPDMIDTISEETDIEPHIIKVLIWENSSKYNFREKSKIIKSDVWKRLFESLSKYRYNIKYNLSIF